MIDIQDEITQSLNYKIVDIQSTTKRHKKEVNEI